MATMCCPNCQTVIKKPTNVLAWIAGILAALFVGGVLLVVVCLTAVSAIGANAEDQFDRISADLRKAEVQNEQSYPVSYTHLTLPTICSV